MFRKLPSLDNPLDAIKKAGDGLHNIVDKGVNAVHDAHTTAGQALGKVVHQGLDIAGEGAKVLKDTVTNPVDKIQETAEGMKDSLDGLVKNLGEKLSNPKLIAEKLNDPGHISTPFIKDVESRIVNEAKEVGDKINDSIRNIGEGKPSIDKTNDMAKQVEDTIISPIKNLEKETHIMMDKVTDAGKGVESMVDDLKSIVKGTLKEGVVIDADLSKNVTDAIANVDTAVDKMKDSVKEISDDIHKIEENIEGLMDQFEKSGGTAMFGSLDKMADFVNNVKASGLLTLIRQQLSLLWTLVQRSFQSFIAFMGTIAQSLGRFKKSDN